LKVPIGQLSQMVAPGVILYVPTGHAVHEELLAWAVSTCVVPAWQNMQSTAPVSS
jgi:hypothetical protein